MRKLTIQRTDSYIDALTTLNIYIEDAVSGDILINEIRCRKLGELGNGDTKTFDIEEYEAKVFAIANSLSPNMCDEYYQLPEGENDISLSGQNMIHPEKGNIFHFDNNKIKVMSEKRKKDKKRKWLIITIATAAAVLNILVVVFGIFTLLPKLRSDESGYPIQYDNMTLMLPYEFDEVQFPKYMDWEAAYKSDNAEVIIIKSEFVQGDSLSKCTASQYAAQYIRLEGFQSTVRSASGSLTYFIYTYPDYYTYVYYVYKAEDAFWIVRFGAPEEKFNDYKKEFESVARTVRFR